MTAVRYIAAQPSFNPGTACYPKLVSHEAAVFVDFSFTAGTSAAQDRSLRTGLMRAYDALPPNGRLSIFTTARDTSATLATPVLVVCRPPAKPAEQALIGTPAKPPAYLQRVSKEARAAYMKQVEQLLADAKSQEKRAYDSPILEQLRAISEFPFSAPLQRLYSYSDGLENTTGTQFCAVKGHLPPFGRFKKTDLYGRIKPAGSFTGAAVQFWMVETARLPSRQLPYCTAEELRKWWEAYFKAAGAASVDLIPLRYGAG